MHEYCDECENEPVPSNIYPCDECCRLEFFPECEDHFKPKPRIKP